MTSEEPGAPKGPTNAMAILDNARPLHGGWHAADMKALREKDMSGMLCKDMRLFPGRRCPKRTYGSSLTRGSRLDSRGVVSIRAHKSLRHPDNWETTPGHYRGENCGLSDKTGTRLHE